MESYENLLENAYGKIKVIEGTGERFEIPLVVGRFEGKKTIINNLKEIASHIRRDPDHLLKYLLKELAVKGTIENDRVIIIGKVGSKSINPKIEKYCGEFVLCQECKKPDTELEKNGKNTVLHCLACGAKHPVHTKI